MSLVETLGLFAPDPNQGPEYPQPQSSQLAFMARLLVSADLSPDMITATGGCPGFVPGPAFGEKTPLESIDNLRLTRWGCEKYEASGPRKRGKSAGERKASAQLVPASALLCKAERNERSKGFLFPSAFSLLSRMLCIRIGGSFRRLNRRKSAQRTLLVSPDLTADEIPATGGHRRFVRRARSTTASSKSSAFQPATAGTKPILQILSNPLLRVQGTQYPGGVRGNAPPFSFFLPFAT